MADAAVAELLDAYQEASTLEEAELALKALEQRTSTSEIAIGDLYDGLAELAAEEDDFGLAVRAQRRALELGCEMPTLAREMLGWYLIKDGRRIAGEAEFDALRRELGDEPELMIALGNARSDAGDEQAALRAFDEALKTAKAFADPYAIDRARVEREACRAHLGLPPDEDDRLAVRRRLLRARPGEQVVVAVGWFPREQHADALRGWPDLHDDLADADDYCRHIERHLRELVEATGRRPRIAPLTVKELLELQEREGLDAADARARLAADLHRRGEALDWPPGRNDPCWCGSGRKYKRCLRPVISPVETLQGIESGRIARLSLRGRARSGPSATSRAGHAVHSGARAQRPPRASAAPRRAPEAAPAR